MPASVNGSTRRKRLPPSTLAKRVRGDVGKVAHFFSRIENTMVIEEAYIQVIAVLTGLR
jgi:hypothetical protein